MACRYRTYEIFSIVKNNQETVYQIIFLLKSIAAPIATSIL